MNRITGCGWWRDIDSMSASSAEAMNSPTLTARATHMGMTLGTAAYMAPEQAKGRPVDRRADVWAFGCVLFEMLTGTRAFPGEDVSETLASVLKTEPGWALLPADIPAAIRRLLGRCLEKDFRRLSKDDRPGEYWAKANGAPIAPAETRAIGAGDATHRDV